MQVTNIHLLKYALAIIVMRSKIDCIIEKPNL